MTGPRNRVVLVTGGSAGIGRATVVRLAGEGARVVPCARDGERLDEAVGDLAGVTGLVADVADARDRAMVVERVLDEHGRLDAVVLNAGLGWAGRGGAECGTRLARAARGHAGRGGGGHGGAEPDGRDRADPPGPAAPTGGGGGARPSRRRRGVIGGRVGAGAAADRLLRHEGRARRVREGPAPRGHRARRAGALGESLLRPDRVAGPWARPSAGGGRRVARPPLPGDRPRAGGGPDRRVPDLAAVAHRRRPPVGRAGPDGRGAPRRPYAGPDPVDPGRRHPPARRQDRGRTGARGSLSRLSQRFRVAPPARPIAVAAPSVTVGDAMSSGRGNGVVHP